MVFSTLQAGGAEVTALELIRALRGSGLTFVAASVKGGSALAGALASAGVVVHERIARFKHDPVGLWRMRRIIRRERIDAVVIVGVPRDGMFYGLLGALASGRAVRRIVWCKSSPTGQSRHFTSHLRAYAAAGLAETVVCTSRAQRDALAARGIAARRLTVIYNGVDVDGLAHAAPRRPTAPPHKRLIVQVANVMPDKDPLTLLRAAGILAARRDDFHVVLAGRDTNGPAMARAVRATSADGVVSLGGHCPDVAGLLASADVFVLSTRGEVFSVATLEALAAGLPVIVSDIGAFDEMFTAGVEGLKVRPGDPAALADAIERVLDAPALGQALGVAARRRAERFSRRRMADEFLRLLAPAG